MHSKRAFQLQQSIAIASDFVIATGNRNRPLKTIPSDCSRARRQIIRKQFFRLTDVRAIGLLTPRQFMCVIGAFAESTYEGARITQKNSSV